MKGILIAIIYVMLALVMLAGCATELPEGSVKFNVYTSESAELTFTKPEDWRFEYGQWGEHLWSDGVPVDMSAYETADKYGTPAGTYISVAYEDLAKTGKTDCDEEAYFDLMKENARNIPDYNSEFSDYTEIKIGRNTFKAMCMTDPNFNSTYYYIRRKGNCMICICASIKNGDIDSVMANFS